MFRFMTPVALLGILAWGILTGIWFARAGPDTSREVADRLRAGMTLAEAERVVGAPPEDYRLEHDRSTTFSFSCALPRVITWTTYHGRITVVDGYETMLGKPGVPTAQYPGGVIDSVDWSPVEPPAYSWRVRSPLAVTAAVLAGLLLVLRAAQGCGARRHVRGDDAVVPDTAQSS
ncbi:hypothetical protein [Urbifossiella limnaea]|uniref:Uncharacterized protein n=1 Tax=Urbifossiella limnaea TaxID=2528023 RepID=A0A517XSU6_9BACT|nr:hypothetical protein [Urbifossiella limnaea]QDU20562.1 hypothetical protein ETAA1_25170 [Urbifossiella limnaea]